MDKLKYGFANMTQPRPADYRDSEDHYDENELSDDYSDEDVCEACDGDGCTGCMGGPWECSGGCGACDACCSGDYY
jgi:hypothetical protein